ncbi:MAG: heme-binding protein [Asticcacaulis sp.]|uniref:GlcG/HbpS family heme-binding protein n=1 Tax=Asticcacaulis sp. TaxID=1872648 RepID=UPI0039E59370
MKTAICLFALVLAGAANAQATSDPTRLPGDSPPPALATMLRPPSGRPLPPPDMTPGVPAALALEAVQTAIDTCSAEGLRVGVALTNSAGYLRAALTTDGARPGVIYGAVQKDLAAMAFKAPTSEVQTKLRADPALASQVLPNMEVRPGAVPIIINGQVLGAIAVDGATAQQDEVCAQAGVAKIQDRLK